MTLADITAIHFSPSAMSPYKPNTSCKFLALDDITFPFEKPISWLNMPSLRLDVIITH